MDVYLSQSDGYTPTATILEPRGHKREVTFQSYSANADDVRPVGTIIKDETFQNNAGIFTSLQSETSNYQSDEISTAPDQEAHNSDTLKSPSPLVERKATPQTGHSSTTTFGNYDRFGNVGFKVETAFNGTTIRRTEYQYEHSNGDGDELLFENNNFIHAISDVKVLDASSRHPCLRFYTTITMT